ncbi:MAG: S9 family peptidase [Ignavibacterium sp.]|nr:S9 family peptidase [Ignavibacterium sp.]
MYNRFKYFVISLLIILTSHIIIAQKRAITIDDLWALKRISTFDINSDGSKIVFAATSFSFETNKGNSDIYLVNSDGSELKAILTSEKSESSPRFVPNSNLISFIKNGQIWTCNIDGSNEKQITNIYSGVNDYKWSNDGNRILFTSSVYPDCKTQECNESKDKEAESSKVKAKIFEQLMYRHWNDWRGDKRSHLFMYDLKTNSYKDLNEGLTEDVPPLALGSSNDFNFSPDGNEIVYTLNPEFSTAISTNNEIYLLKLDDKSSPKLLSESKGVDCQPIFSPDGKYISWTSMKRAGFEADKKDLILYDRKTGKTKNLTETLDRSVEDYIWSNDSKFIYFIAQNEINTSIYKLDLVTGKISLFHNENYNAQIKLSNDGKILFFLKQKATMPYEIFSINSNGSNLKQITSINSDILSKLEMNPVETFWSVGANGDKVQSILVKPPFFDPSKKYPMIFLIHGGPQGAWEDNFHFRWNYQMFASEGYVVVAPNPRGSTGYGQKFTDEISGDWGGKVYEDLMNAYDYAINNFSFIDKNNTFAAGASYGGYMINWIAGHTDRFNALVSHAGVFNLESMYGTTEELWFPEWEFTGTPWEKREVYHKWSPHRYIHNCKTPVLIVHGAYDFRVSEEQAFQLFTSLKRLGVDTKFLYFPDETHFVAKPLNSKLWWATVLDWFRKYRK